MALFMKISMKHVLVEVILAKLFLVPTLGKEVAADLLFVAQEILEPDGTWIMTTVVVTSTVTTLPPGGAGTRRLVALTRDKSLHLLELFQYNLNKDVLAATEDNLARRLRA